MAEPVVAQLDPERFIMYHLYRDSTKYIDGQHVKASTVLKCPCTPTHTHHRVLLQDLTNLNRDLSKVIVVDTDPCAYSFHPSNGVALKQWEGQDRDTTLFELAHFLRGEPHTVGGVTPPHLPWYSFPVLADHRVADFRPVLDSLKSQGEDVLATFRLNQAKLEQEEERRKEEKGRKGGGVSHWSGLRWGSR